MNIYIYIYIYIYMNITHNEKEGNLVICVSG